MVTLTIDGIQVTVPPGTMILEAAAKAGVKIPTLCNNKRLMPFGACRICVVQQKGRKGLTPSCFTPVRNGMEILTNTPDVVKARRTQLQLILISHPLDCPVCDAGGQCQLQDLVYEYGITENPFKGDKADAPVDHVSPFIERNINRCILCGMCVRIDNEVVGANELSFMYRGINVKIGTDFDRSMNCEFCGQCISVCPVGALNDRLFLHKARPWDLKETNTTCGYCSVGCTLTIGTRKNRILRVRADENLGANEGNLCVKGRFGWEYIHSTERLTTPLIRQGDALIPATWDEAIGLVARRFREIGEKGGLLAGLGSARLTNEEAYLFQKFTRGVLKTNHVDHAGGYAYAAPLALRESLGYAASTNSFREIRQADVIIALRSDLSETHPVVKYGVVVAVKRHNAKLLVINSRNIGLNRFSSQNLRVQTGTEVALINGLIRTILDEGLADLNFIQSRTRGLDELKESLADYAPEKLETITGIAAEKIREAARLFAQAPKGVILISTGSASDKQDAALARAAANLALVTGKIGREGTGIFVLGEKNNSQGALDMGLTPALLPGYASLQDPAERERFARAWKMGIPADPGMDGLAILRAAEEGKVKGLYLVGENPLVSYPEGEQAKKALAALEFLVVQDCFLTETAALAHVVLPAVTFAEKEGTFTSAERRIQRVRPALTPNGEARSDLRIFNELSKAMGTPLGAGSAGEVMDEIRSVVPLYAGIDYHRLDADGQTAGLQWPCAAGEPGSPFLYGTDFPGGKARLLPAPWASEMPDEGFPWVLATGPILFHSGTLSTRSPGLVRLHGESFVEIHPDDAVKLGLADGQPVTLESRHGRITVKAVLTDGATPGILFVPSHFAKGGGQRLTGRDGLTRVKINK